MKKSDLLGKAFLTTAFLVLSQSLFAQSKSEGSNLLMYTLIGVGIILLFGVVLSVSDNLLQIEAKRSGVENAKDNFSLFPRLSEIFGKSNPLYTRGDFVYRLKRGHNILLEGEADKLLDNSKNATRFALRPADFRMLPPIPKLDVGPGDEVLAGDPLFHDKNEDRIKYTSPVSGEVVEVRRGAKRAISDVIILADKKIRHRKFSKN